VGSAVAGIAIARGWKVWALTRNPERATHLRAVGVNVVESLLSAGAWHEKIPRDPRFVLDSVSAGGGGLPGYWESYVEGSKSILRWAAGGIPATFVYTGSTSVYAASDGTVVDETSEVGGSETSGPLLEAERLLRSSSLFERLFILRLAGIYGPGRHHLLDQLIAGAELLPGTGRHRLNLVHQEDIVSAIYACFDSAKTIAGDTYNVCGDVAASKEEVTEWMAGRLGRPPPRFAHDAGMRGPTPGLVRGRSGPVPDRVVSNGRIARELGWRPQFPDFRSGYEQIFHADRIRVKPAGSG